MKTIYKIAALVLCTLSLCTFFGCQPQEMSFDHELPQFETRANAILIEFIAPTGTAVDDELFIFGAFNGLDETMATSVLEWKLEKARNSDKKWGIYLFPENFVDGKTLADGFSFVSKKAGGERDIKGNPVTHTLDVTVGTRTNVWADRWAAYFSGDDQPITHDGYVVYVLDESGFDNLTLYMYGDINDLNGAWPGMKPTGKETINGTEFSYFDMGSDNKGLTETFIFNDNGDSKLADYGPVTFEGDNLFLHIHEDGTIEKIGAVIGHDGPTVYVLDGKDWGMNTTLYMWGNVDNLNGAWPGMTVTGTVKIGDYTYLYFDLGEANKGLKESLIFSNNGASQLGDYPGNDQLWTIEEDLYLYIGANGVQVIADPENPGDLVWFDPKASPKEEALIDLYFYTATDSLVLSHLYAWGTAEAFGAWPGKAFADMDSISILGMPLLHTSISGHVGDAYHLIVNGKDSVGAEIKLPDYDIDVDDTSIELYLKIADGGVKPLQITAKNPRR